MRGDVILTGTPSGVGLRLWPLKRRVAALVKDRFRKAELLVSGYATASALLRPGDVVEVDAGAAVACGRASRCELHFGRRAPEPSVSSR